MVLSYGNLIPAILKIDTRPSAGPDGSDAVWIADEETPGVLTSVEDFFIGVPDQGAEFVLTQIGPDVLHGIELWRIGGQRQQRNIVGNNQLGASLMPTGAVADEQGVAAGRDFAADFLEMLVHRFGVGLGHDHSRPDGAFRTYGSKYVGRDVAVVAHHQRARADLRPDIGVASLLTDPRFVLEPDFYRATDSGRGECGLCQLAEVFLKANSASGSFFG